MKLIDRATMHEKGLSSDYIDKLKGRGLSEEAAAVMALILEKCKIPPTPKSVNEYAQAVFIVQDLMPSGVLRSRQILALIAYQAGLR